MAIDDYALTTLHNAKDHLKVTDSTDDNIIERMIDAASGAIETYCGHKFLSQSYSEWYDGDGKSELFLNQYPVTDVTRVSVGIEDTVAVSNSSTDATRATVAVTSTGVTLVIIGGASAGTDTITFAAATTMTALETAIVALGKGWSASVQADFGTIVSTELREQGARGCLGVQVSLQMAEPDSLTDYDVDWSLGILRSWSGWASGARNILVEYTAGSATVPYDIEQACLALVGVFYNRTKHDPALKSEKLGDYAYEMAVGGQSADMPDYIKSTLNRHKLHGGWA